MDAIFVGCLKAVYEELPGSTWVESVEQFSDVFEGHRVVLIDPNRSQPFDVGFAAVLAVTTDGDVGEWDVHDLVHPDTPTSVVAARVRRWVSRKASNARLLHDLRAPIGVLMGNCQLLKEEVCGPVTPRQEKALAAMESAVARFTQALDKVR